LSAFSLGRVRVLLPDAPRSPGHGSARPSRLRHCELPQFCWDLAGTTTHNRQQARSHIEFRAASMQRRVAGFDKDMGQFWRREGGTCSRRFCIPLRPPRARTPPASGYNQHETVRHCTAAAYTREAPRKPARLALKTNSEFAGKILSQRSRPTHSRGLA